MPKDNIPEIAKLVRVKRTKYGITQQVLAEKLGYTDNRIVYLIESGRMKVPKQKIKRLCKVLFIDRAAMAEVMVMDYANSVEKLLNVRFS